MTCATCEHLVRRPKVTRADWCSYVPGPMWRREVGDPAQFGCVWHSDPRASFAWPRLPDDAQIQGLIDGTLTAKID